MGRKAMRSSKGAVPLRLLEKDTGTKRVRLRVDTIDDLWFLEKLLQKGTVVGAETQRKLDQRPDKIRPDRTERVRLFLRIAVEGTEFQDFRDVLRIKGAILEGPPGVEGHHSFTVGPGTILELTFPALTDLELGILEEAQERSSAPKALAVFVDDRTEQLFRLHDYGIEELGTTVEVSMGKMFEEGSTLGPSRFHEITEMVRTNLGEGTPLLLIGPGFFKELLGAHLRTVLGISASRTVMVASSSNGRSAVIEALTGPKGMSGLLSQLRISQELELLDALMARIGEGGLATYGRQEVMECLLAGAVEHLLLSEDRFGEERGGPLLELCTNTHARSTIISSRHEPGKMFSRMGGIAAFLRYRPTSIRQPTMP